ncbi:glycine cleavage system protein H [candidate division WOR-1 bacterium RIFOXYD2_FULL_36_8]|uniref:Glycine cleavage system H protein n=1 Tax=candidate division WOR-1 bacterium RIFOXYB2_FULL_36_35 TaxID=1802578 RepID=A0A1F4RYP3_UNCSA|nr:MAG: glycine cleavage system protein H [candidate division WOR-1 bacterium RIFOXYA2_FULL_36_21]OGC13294.1 MAG: glycine cleavage system protein H [candidate division WOR-1 bacterium RIFOXYB2_FULL_36_35]OGC16615.1 MAG: glycine cleavage system protein H [candidate division WOR-1 bacterium RIFOXYA12_FULL_36_13]OGC38985.1 MAG: glycine cleavage system protein H [candidate division WOR-1 bacterium RIFOXYD2_FULL_36_8]
MQTPEDRKYSKDHEWAKIEGKIATVGITFYAQHELGDIVFVETPPLGDTLKQGQEFGVAESVKTVSSLYAPMSGKVIEINKELEATPALVNDDPYEKGWILKLEINNPDEEKNLLVAKDYDSTLAN